VSVISDQTQLDSLLLAARASREKEGVTSQNPITLKDVELLKSSGATVVYDGPQVGGMTHCIRLRYEGYVFYHSYVYPSKPEVDIHRPSGRPC
jgi:hypothetical protein